jgi:signal peptidase I
MNQKIKGMMEWLEAVLIAIAVALCVLLFLVRIVVVDGNSMNPTLQNGEKLMISSLFYSIDRGDVVIIRRENDEPLIKRVIATQGETIDIDFETGEVKVDQKVLKEPYIKELISHTGEGEQDYPLTVPEGYIFVMGDNRNDSLDSRFEEVGLISTEDIFGEVLFRLSPIDRVGFIS